VEKLTNRREAWTETNNDIEEQGKNVDVAYGTTFIISINVSKKHAETLYLFDH
jgi:hypothetical protein